MKWTRDLVRLTAVIAFCMAASSAHGQTSEAVTSAPPLEQPGGASVMFFSEKLFDVYDKLGPFSAEERAKAISERLSRLSKDPLSEIAPIQSVELEQWSVIFSGDIVIMTVTNNDALPTGRPRSAVAQEYAGRIRKALTTVRESLTPKALLTDVALALLYTAILFGILVVFRKLFPRLYERINSWRARLIPLIRIQRVEVLTREQLADFLASLVKVIRAGATVLVLYVYLTSVLGLFPWTRALSASLLNVVLSTLRTIGSAFASFLPDVVAIVVIVVVVRYIVKLIHLLFNGMERGAVSFPGFHREWAQPTYKIVRFLAFVFAAVAIFPYIPGSQSPAFRGISVFLGILLSFGSSNAVSNVVAGVVLTYMRPFRPGDRVRVADTIGDVTGRELLVTRVRTIKNVDITIPNAMVLGSHIVNYSSSARDRGLILHTSVTIGYDAPWRKIHELLLAAAHGTSHILAKPEPYVWQTSLDDFYVTYELNAYTDQPNLMAAIYAELHQSIQDKFNEAGVEIMSPHYSQIRDGNRTTIPAQYLPENYEIPGFRIRPLANLSGGSKDVASTKGGPHP